MKHLLFILLTLTSITGISQTYYDYRNETTISGGWEIPKPSIYSRNWDTTMKFTSPKANLKHGVGDLIVSDIFTYYAVGCGIVGSNLVVNNEGGSFKRGVGFTIVGGGVAFVIASHIHRRRGLKRLYWGMNSITIPLN